MKYVVNPYSVLLAAAITDAFGHFQVCSNPLFKPSLMQQTSAAKITWLHFPIVTVAVWLPFAFLAIELLIEKRTYRRFLFAVIVWTVNDPVLATSLVESGVDAIITDDPRIVPARPPTQ